MSDLEAQLRAYGSALDGAQVAVGTVVEAPTHRVRRSYVVAVAAGIAVAVAASAIAVSMTRSDDARPPRIVTPASSTTVPAPRAAGVFALGDSVMFGARGALESSIPGVVVDAVLSRQVDQTVPVLLEYEKAGSDFGTVVIDVGTNGPTTAAALDAIMRAAGRREVYFVTLRVPRAWESANNALLRALPERWPNAHVIEWHDYANAHDDWFDADGFHLTPAGQQAYSLLIESSIGRLPPPTPPAPSGLDVVDVITERTLAPVPLAVAGGDAWIASQSLTGPGVHLEQRDPSTGKVLGAIDVPQEGLFSIAGDGDTLWIAGGGDGGVPQTSVSRVDVRTRKVVFTKTLTGKPCSCPIVAGSAGVWLVGNSSNDALHVSSVDGHVIADVKLPHPALLDAAIETRSRLLVGLDDGTVAVIDPATNRIEPTIARPVVGDPPVEAVVAMSPAAVPAVGSDPAIDGIVVRANGSVDGLFVTGWQLNEILSVDFSTSTVVEARGLVWLFGGDRLEVASTHAVVSNGFAWDASARAFDRVPESPTSQSQGFRDAVTVDNMLWVVYDPGVGNGQPSVVVVKAPENFPFK